MYITFRLASYTIHIHEHLPTSHYFFPGSSFQVVLSHWGMECPRVYSPLYRLSTFLLRTSSSGCLILPCSTAMSSGARALRWSRTLIFRGSLIEVTIDGRAANNLRTLVEGRSTCNLMDCPEPREWQMSLDLRLHPTE